MKPQKYSNHRHVVPLYHGLTFIAMAVLLGLAVTYLINHYRLRN